MGKKYFKSKNVVITGAASGIGRVFALKLASLGANLVISDINMDRLKKVKKELERYSGTILALKCDVTNQKNVQALAQTSISNLKNIHFLFSNAGIYMGGPFEHLEIFKWEKIMKVNVWGMIFVVKAFINKMLEQGFGHIIITSSIAGSLGAGAVTAYSTTKFANSGFGEAIYGEYHNKGINVSIVCPFPLRTNLIESFEFSFPPELFEGLTSESIEKGTKAAKSYYWKEFTSKGSGFLGGFEVNRAVKRIMKKISKKKLYVFERRYGRLFQFLRGYHPHFYKILLNISGKRHNKLVEQCYQKFLETVKPIEKIP